MTTQIAPYFSKSLRLLICLAVVMLYTSCNNENAPECFRKAGKTVVYTVETDDFSTLDVGEGISVVLVEGPEHNVTVETGENLKDNIHVSVTDGKLSLTNSTSCNWVRQYNTTTVTVTAPNITYIFSGTQFNITSAGTLHYPELLIQSGMFRGDTPSAFISLDVVCNHLTVEDNQNLDCFVTGTTENLLVDFYSNNGHFDGTGLAAKNVAFFHRSTNDITVNATETVKGTLFSTGNLVLLNRPPVVEVTQKYTGHVVYR